MVVQVSVDRRFTDYLTVVIECVGEGAMAPERTEINHPAFLPEKRVQSQRSVIAKIVGRRRRSNRIDGVGLSDDLTLVVDIQSLRIRAAQGTQILHHSVLPEEGPCLRHQSLKRIDIIYRVA